MSGTQEDVVERGHGADFRQTVVVGEWFTDGWSSPYLRGNWNLKSGRYLVTAQVWNPDMEVFSENSIVLRCGLDQIASTGPLVPGQQYTLSAIIAFQEDTPEVVLSLRSSVEWKPAPPDIRELGFVLLNWKIEPVE